MGVRVLGIAQTVGIILEASRGPLKAAPSSVGAPPAAWVAFGDFQASRWAAAAVVFSHWWALATQMWLTAREYIYQKTWL